MQVPSPHVNSSPLQTILRKKLVILYSFKIGNNYINYLYRFPLHPETGNWRQFWGGIVRPHPLNTPLTGTELCSYSKIANRTRSAHGKENRYIFMENEIWRLLLYEAMLYYLFINHTLMKVPWKYSTFGTLYFQWLSKGIGTLLASFSLFTSQPSLFPFFLCPLFNIKKWH